MSIFKFRGLCGRNNMPFLELEKMRNQMESIYNSLAGSISQFRKNSGVFPLVNLAEDEDNLYLTAELPGAAADSLDVSVKGETLSLKGQVPTATTAADEVNYHRRERESGTFRRVLNLPAKVEVDKVEAVFKNGILTVTMPKVAEAKAHKISIKRDL